jgi:hypothetical protein
MGVDEMHKHVEIRTEKDLFLPVFLRPESTSNRVVLPAPEEPI